MTIGIDFIQMKCLEEIHLTTAMNRKTNNNTFLGLYIPANCKKRLEALANSQQRSVSGLVRVIVEQYLSKKQK